MRVKVSLFNEVFQGKKKGGGYKNLAQGLFISFYILLSFQVGSRRYPCIFYQHKFLYLEYA